jgi:hypothetical protein
LKMRVEDTSAGDELMNQATYDGKYPA